MLNLFTYTIGTLAVLTRARVGRLMFAKAYHGNAATPQMNINLQHDQAIAYAQISRLNR